MLVVPVCGWLVAVYQVFSVSGCCPFSFVLGEVLSVFLFSWGPFFWLRVFSFWWALSFGNKFLFIQKKNITGNGTVGTLYA